MTGNVDTEAGFDERTERLFYLGAGPATAILLGMLLVPLRESTSASNLTFAFIVLTIAVGEFGGRWAALATSIASALSLNFFLTRPYLTLAIHEAEDVIAFLGLALCGLVAASFASERGRRIARLDRSQQHLQLLHGVLEQAEPSPQLEERLARVLRACRDVLPLTSAVVRDPRGYVFAVSDSAATLRALPEQELRAALPRFARSLPEQGVRIPLALAGRPLGWLDVWGDRRSAGAEARQTLSDVARVIALMLSGGGLE